jgi:hypothetical protein
MVKGGEGFIVEKAGKGTGRVEDGRGIPPLAFNCTALD